MSDSTAVYEFGPFVMDSGRRFLQRDGDLVNLRPQEFDTLLYMLVNRMERITLDQLKKDVWQGEVSDSDVRSHVSRVRRALGDKPPKIIKTVNKEKAYRFVAVVRVLKPAVQAETVDAQHSFLELPTSDLRLIKSTSEIIAENIAIAREAERFLVATGSRSRDASYLEAIEASLTAKPQLIHYRILFGAPHHAVLLQHLVRLLALRNPENREYGAKTINIACYKNCLEGEPERFMCANEQRALVVLPSLTGVGHYDTGLIMRGSAQVEGILRYARELYLMSSAVETTQAIEELGLLRKEPARS